MDDSRSEAEPLHGRCPEAVARSLCPGELGDRCGLGSGAKRLPGLPLAAEQFSPRSECQAASGKPGRCSGPDPWLEPLRGRPGDGSRGQRLLPARCRPLVGHAPCGGRPFPGFRPAAPGRLRLEPEVKRQVLIGFVETLNGRPNTQNRPEGQVMLRLITSEGEALRARADLSADEYALAERARRHNAPFALEGVLRQAGRTCRIEQVSNFEVLHESQPAGEGRRPCLRSSLRRNSRSGKAGLPCSSLSAECHSDKGARQRPPQNRLYVWWARSAPPLCRVGKARSRTAPGGRPTVHSFTRGGRRQDRAAGAARLRFTPTRVGKTCRRTGCRCRRSVHPHTRGEDAVAVP